jgi:hypothetical protein
LDVAIEMVKEVIQFFWFTSPDHKHVISVMEPTDGLTSFPVDCHSYTNDSDRQQQLAHGIPLRVFVELSIEAEKTK